MIGITIEKIKTIFFYKTDPRFKPCSMAQTIQPKLLQKENTHKDHNYFNIHYV